MNANDYLKTRFLKQPDFPGPKIAEIARYEDVDVAGPGEKPDVRLVVFFKGFDRGMIFNATNIKRCIKGFGPEMDDWIGREVEIYVDEEVEYGGQITGGLRVRPILKKAKKRTAAATADAVEGVASMEDDLPWEKDRE